MERDGAFLVHRPTLVALERLFERDLAFHAGQRRTETEVNPVSECNVQPEVTANVELICFGIDTLVATR